MARELEDEGTDADLDLPPLDDGEVDAPDAAEPDEPLEPEDAGGLDDSPAGELDVGPDLEEDLDDEEAAEDDDGPHAAPIDDVADLDGERTDLGEEPEGEADAEGIVVDEHDDGDDGGAEGTSEDPEDEIDEAALPDIDDGQDSVADDALAEALLAESEGELVPWASARFGVIDGAGANVPCRGVVAAAGRVAAAGEVLLLVEDGARAARRLPFGDGGLAVALADDALIAATARGTILVSRDFGATASALGSYRAPHASSSVELASTPGRFWIREGTALSSCTSTAQAPTLVRDRGVLAMAASGGTLIALTLSAGAPGIERFRGDDEHRTASPLPEPARTLAERAKGTVLVAACGVGRGLAVGDGVRVAVSRDGGATFALLDPRPVRAFAFAGDHEDAALLGLLVPEGSPSAYVVSWSAAGDVVRLAELSGFDRTTSAALVWDASRELVWVASGGGLVALGLPQRH